MSVRWEAVGATQVGIEEDAVFAGPFEPESLALLSEAFVLLNLHSKGRSC